MTASIREINYWQPMSHPLATNQDTLKVIVAADGVEITDKQGHRTLDAVGGLWNVNLGYSCDPIKQAISQQLDTLPYYSSFPGVVTDQAITLSQRLVERFRPEGMHRVFYTSGGSDSIESSLRLARQYHKIRGERDRYKFISLKKGYHGTHFGGASINGNTKFRRNYEPLLAGCFQIAAPWTYRNPFKEDDAKLVAELCASLLEEEIKFQSPDTVAAFIMEPVLGAGGVIVPHETFMPMVREICDRHGVLLIADEVITAFGRTGAQSGSRLWNVKPDMMCIAKAVTNGYFPLGATLIGDKVTEAFESNTDSLGEIGHGYTYSGHPVGAAAAIACLDELDRLQVADNAGLMGSKLMLGLEALQARFPVIGNVRGIGLMQALEFVADRESKAPLSKVHMAQFGESVYQAGVSVRVSGNVVILSPPLIINEDHVSRILTALETGLMALGKTMACPTL